MKRAKKPVIPERVLHAQVADYLARALPKDIWWTTIGHGGGGLVRGRQLKRAGLRPGTPDILILWKALLWPGIFGAYWIELKSIKGQVSADQKRVIKDLKAIGCDVAVCRSLEDVETSLRGWGIPLRARLR